MVRIITWRLLANMAKHPETQKMIVEDREFITWAADVVLKDLVSDKTLVNGTMMALNNMLFANGALDIDTERLVALLGGFWNVMQQDNENSIAAALNLSILILHNDRKTLVPLYKVNEKKAKLESMTLLKNVAIANLAKDLLFVVSKN